MTRTPHPLKFMTYSDQPSVTVPTSMQILGTGTRDVQILTPLKCSGILSTFVNSVSIGSALLPTVNCFGVTGGSTFGGKILAGNIKATGIIETNQIIIIGATGASSVTIANVDGTEVANFANDFKCRMNGDTSILGSLYCSAPIDAYRLTCTEIKARDTGGTAIVTSTGITSMQILSNATGDVEILTPLKIKSSLTTIDNSILIGTAQSVASIGLNVNNSGLVGGNLTVTGNISCNNITGYLKPFIGLKIDANGTISSNVGQVPTSAITVTVASSNAYSITFTTPHPLGDNYLVFTQPRTGSSSSVFVASTANQTTYSITVWNRTAANAITTNNFYVHSVP